MRTVLGLFDDLTRAQRAIHELVELGFSPDRIGIVASPAAQRTLQSDPRINLWSCDVGDVGRVAAGGPIRDVLRGENGGVDLTATLRRYGLEGELAERYVAGVRKGETLEAIIVEDEDSIRAYEVMRRHSHVLPQASGKAEPVANPATTHRWGEEQRTVPIVKEELRVGKRDVETGMMSANVRVVERPVTTEVKLREEHIEIERRAVDRPIRAGEDAFREDHIELHEYAERPLAAKEVRVVEEVVIRKGVTEHVERITDRLRSTEIDIERPFDESSFRQHFERLGRKSERFEDYAPAYRLGHELRGDARLRGRRWDEIAPRVKQAWESKHPGSFEKFQEVIRHAWER